MVSLVFQLDESGATRFQSCHRPANRNGWLQESTQSKVVDKVVQGAGTAAKHEAVKVAPVERPGWFGLDECDVFVGSEAFVELFLSFCGGCILVERDGAACERGYGDVDVA